MTKQKKKTKESKVRCKRGSCGKPPKKKITMADRDALGYRSERVEVK